MRILGPPNPIVHDAAGRDYRAMPAREWARRASIDIDVCALAWALASEAPDVDRYPQYAGAIAHAIENAASDARITVHARVTMDGVPLLGGRQAPHAGHYARQSGRWCASLQWPAQAHLAQAATVHARTMPAHEARLWCDLRVMDRGTQGGKQLAYDADGIVRKRWAARWAWIGPMVGIDPFVLCLFRQRRADDQLEPARAMVEDGRRRWTRVG